MSKGYACSYKKWQMLMKNLLGKIQEKPYTPEGYRIFSIKRRGRLFKTIPRWPGFYLNPAFIWGPAFIKKGDFRSFIQA